MNKLGRTSGALVAPPLPALSLPRPIRNLSATHFSWHQCHGVAGSSFPRPPTGDGCVDTRYLNKNCAMLNEAESSEGRRHNDISECPSSEALASPLEWLECGSHLGSDRETRAPTPKLANFETRPHTIADVTRGRRELGIASSSWKDEAEAGEAESQDRWKANPKAYPPSFKSVAPRPPWHSWGPFRISPPLLAVR